MKIWLVERLDHYGYDQFDSFVCAAETEEQARFMHPWGEDARQYFDKEAHKWLHSKSKEEALFNSWTNPETKVKVTELGTASPGIEQSVLCASFNAG